MSHATETLDIAQDLGLSMEHLDEYDPRKYCPGEYLWNVTVDGEKFLMAGLDESSVETRLFFHVFVDGRRVNTDRKSHDVTITKIGDNPDAQAWKIARNWD